MLWVRGDGLTVSVDMNRAQIFVVPSEDTEDGHLQRVSWRNFPLVLEGSKLFLGGPYCIKNSQGLFCGTKEHPLVVLLYDGNDQTLVDRVLASARQPNEYWNRITPYSLVLGVVSQLIIAASYVGRPAFRLTALTALVAVFIPLMPLLPPGVLFTSFYRRWWRRGRLYRYYRDVLKFYRYTKQPRPLTLFKKINIDMTDTDRLIRIYEGRSFMLELYAITAACFGILLNFLVILFIFQSLFL